MCKVPRHLTLHISILSAARRLAIYFFFIREVLIFSRKAIVCVCCKCGWKRKVVQWRCNSKSASRRHYYQALAQMRCNRCVCWEHWPRVPCVSCERRFQHATRIATSALHSYRLVAWSALQQRAHRSRRRRARAKRPFGRWQHDRRARLPLQGVLAASRVGFQRCAFHALRKERLRDSPNTKYWRAADVSFSPSTVRVPRLRPPNSRPFPHLRIAFSTTLPPPNFNPTLTPGSNSQFSSFLLDFRLLCN